MTRKAWILAGALFAIGMLEFGLAGADAAGVHAPWRGSGGAPIAAGPPAAIALAASPSAVNCDGTSGSVVTATVTDTAGNRVADGTPVVFNVVIGTATPAEGTTLNGVTASTITPLAATDGTIVRVVSGAAEASIRVDCLGGQQCDAISSPPQLSPPNSCPLSPPCLENDHGRPLSPPKGKPQAASPTPSCPPTPEPCRAQGSSNPTQQNRLSPPHADCPVSPPGCTGAGQDRGHGKPLSPPSKPECPTPAPPSSPPPCDAPSPPPLFSPPCVEPCVPVTSPPQLSPPSCPTREPCVPMTSPPPLSPPSCPPPPCVPVTSPPQSSPPSCPPPPTCGQPGMPSCSPPPTVIITPDSPEEIRLDADPATAGVQDQRNVSSSDPFTVGIEITRASDLYQGYEWTLRYDPTQIELVGNFGNAAQDVFNLCASPTGVGYGQIYGGCLRAGDLPETNYVGAVARVSVRCLRPGYAGISLVDLSQRNVFSTSLLDSGANQLATYTVGVTVNCATGIGLVPIGIPVG